MTYPFHLINVHTQITRDYCLVFFGGYNVVVTMMMIMLFTFDTTIFMHVHKNHHFEESFIRMN